MPRRELGALDPIDSDAFTRRYAVGDLLRDLPAPLRYREIRPDHELPAEVTPADVRVAFAQAVALRDRCPDADRAELDRRTDWSLAIVTEHDSAAEGLAARDEPRDRGGHHDTVVGVLLPALPREYSRPGTEPHPTRLLTLRDLCASDEAAVANGVDRSTLDDDLARLALAAHLAHTIHLLHRNRIAYSDLTLGRVAIASHPPRTMLIGCDPTVGLATPATGTAGQTPAADLDPSRLALCVIRALAKGRGATQLTDPACVGGLLGQPGVDLLTRALGRPPAQRPSAEQISRYLTGRRAELAREAGLADASTLLGFDIAAQLRGALPRLAVPGLPAVGAPPAPAPLPGRPVVDADAHPPPRIELPPVGLGSGAPGLGGVIAHAYVEANQQIGSHPARRATVAAHRHRRADAQHGRDASQPKG